MTAWRDRVWISATAAAAIVAVGFWWTRTDWRRDFPLTGDVAELCAAWMEREASLSYSPTQTFATAWVVLASETGTTARVPWGGYSNVTVTIPAGFWTLGATDFVFLRRTYGTAGSSDFNATARRGFIDEYWDGASVLRLWDLGPSGGVLARSFTSGTNTTRNANADVGGWVLNRATLGHGYAMPPNQHATDAWWLRVIWGTDYSYLYQSQSPSGNTVTPGDVDPDRATYWTPRNYYLLTNAIPSLPVWPARAWGQFDGSTFTAWDFTTPNCYSAATYPSAGNASAALALTPSASSYWADYQDADADPIDEVYFAGRDTADLPTLDGNSVYTAYTNAWAIYQAPGADNIVWTTNALNTLAGWLAKQRVRIIADDGLTNTFSYGYERMSDPVLWSGTFWADFNASYSNVLTDGAWSAVVPYATFNGWGFKVYPQFTMDGSNIESARWVCQFATAGGDHYARIGRGHNTNGTAKVCAHGWLTDIAAGTNATFAIPAGETANDVNAGNYHKLAGLDFDVAGFTNAVWIGTNSVPAYTNQPAASDLPALQTVSDTGAAGYPKYKGWAWTGPYTAALPRWSTLTNHPAIEE